MKNLEKNKSKEETSHDYEAPAIEIVEVEAEKGFALSPDPENPDPF